ncbi:adenylate/guanylate cyclase domain-containing protein [Chryseobacterium sp.]|uniref:adenylate/guanylate cyclase domain-containing protein n=1 Tax=Chryseobacterium sp. TaxID=1871047 RepID=UPI00262A74AB|nr:adenylate/guanylate cyclase domain-containing protein [Chryseobacterium sp.]
MGSKSTADSLLNIGIKQQESGNFAESVLYFNKSLVSYYEHKDFKKAGDCYSYLAISYSLQGNYIQSLSYFEKSISEYKKVRYKLGISSVTNNMGGTYYYLGKFSQALSCYQKVLEIQTEIKDPKTIAITTQNIGGIYSKLEDYTSALKYYRKAYNVYTKLNDVKAIAQNLNSTGSIQVRLKDFDLAYENLSKALQVANEQNDKQIRIEVLNNLGTLFYEQSDYSKALGYFNNTLQLAKEMNSQQYIGDSQIAIGNIYAGQGKNKEAVKKCSEGFTIAQKIGSLSLKKDACDCLYHSYKTLGDDKKALAYYEKSNIFEDSLNSKETSNRMMNMEFQKQQLTDSIAYVKKEHTIQLKHKEEVQKKEKQRNAIIISLGFILVLAGGLWNRLNFVKKSREALRIEKDRSEELLLNILPEEIAEELKQKGSVNARDFNLVSILFTDFKSFTQTAEKMSPQSLVEEINVCFKAFDLISEKYKIEKIKTIGDSYMAAGGIPKPDQNSLKNIVLAGLEMQDFMAERKNENMQTNRPAFEMRLGIHAGPIVAGIVGVKKFQYDVWGDTVNTASRIESNGMVGKVNISESLYLLIKNEDCFSFEYRGNIQAKGKGELKMYFVEASS